MKAEELRIGNYVEHNGNWSYRSHSALTVIKWDSRDWYGVGESTMDLEDVFPIPLTEEWLRKLGFEKEETSNNGTAELIEFKKYILTITKAVTNEDKTVFYVYIFNGNTIYMNYVHQLQNLYFALTGEELTLSELGN